MICAIVKGEGVGWKVCERVTAYMAKKDARSDVVLHSSPTYYLLLSLFIPRTQFIDNMTFIFRIISLYLALLLYLSLGYIESKQWCTLRLWISVGLHMRLLTIIVNVTTVLTIYDIVALPGNDMVSSRFFMAAVCVGYMLLALRLLLPLRDSQEYIPLRWKAKTGPSSTAITLSMTHYLGEDADWRSLLASCRRLHLRSVERFSRLTNSFRRGIVYDPTDILRKRFEADKDSDTVWLPHSDVKTGVYAPNELG